MLSGSALTCPPRFVVADDMTVKTTSADDDFSAVNLSDATFKALEKKMGIVEALLV